MAKIYFKQVLQHHQGLNCHKAASIAIRPIKHSVLQEPQSALLDFNLDHYFNSFWIIVCRWEGQIQIFFVGEFAWYIRNVFYKVISVNPFEERFDALTPIQRVIYIQRDVWIHLSPMIWFNVFNNWRILPKKKRLPFNNTADIFILSNCPCTIS